MRLGDLDALKEALTNTQTSLKYMGVFTVDDIKEFIDNAPTVEYPFYQEAYQTGYEEGKNERPQGEWRSRGYGYYCSICHNYHKNSNFCPDCGADMRGKKNA